MKFNFNLSPYLEKEGTLPRIKFSYNGETLTAKEYGLFGGKKWSFSGKDAEKPMLDILKQVYSDLGYKNLNFVERNPEIVTLKQAIEEGSRRGKENTAYYYKNDTLDGRVKFGDYSCSAEGLDISTVTTKDCQGDVVLIDLGTQFENGETIKDFVNDVYISQHYDKDAVKESVASMKPDELLLIPNKNFQHFPVSEASKLPFPEASGFQRTVEEFDKLCEELDSKVETIDDIDIAPIKKKETATPTQTEKAKSVDDITLD